MKPPKHLTPWLRGIYNIHHAGPRQKDFCSDRDIRRPVDWVWWLTQTPELHQRWDLRFTQITYLSRPDPSQPQRFLYETRIGFGLKIRGEGESVGTSNGSVSERCSALRFWSEDAKSLIREGSGYWKYVPQGQEGESTRFLTLYDYGVRFGTLGRLVDRFIFRPLIGWATAWSFDRLRLWIEKDIDPAVSMRQTLIYCTSRLALAFVWLYEGIVPKLIFRHRDELTMLGSIHLAESARPVLLGIGCVEVAIGLSLLFAWRFLSPLWLTLLAMPAALLAVAIKSPAFLAAPFNPVTLNLSVFALAAIALLVVRDLPTATRCLRRPPREDA